MKPRDLPAARTAPDQIADAAAEWLGRRDGGLSPTEEAEFTAWLGADPRHAAALTRLEAASAALDALSSYRPAHGTPDPDLPLRPVAVSSTRPLPRRLLLPVVLAAAAALTLAWLGLARPWSDGARFAETAATEVGGLRRLALPDGSTIELNTDSAVTITYDRGQRAVALSRGEAHFTVAKDAARPFIVRAGGVDVRAVGTAFNVRLRPGDVDVLVTEGRVQLADAARGGSLLPADGASQPPVLTAGHRALVPAAALATAQPVSQVKVIPVAEIEITRMLAWQSKRLEFGPTPLREVVAEFNRYNSHHLVLGEVSVGEISIGGSFAAADYDTLVRLLEASFGVQAERTPARTTLRLRR